jgi:hypothetical protein
MQGSKVTVVALPCWTLVGLQLDEERCLLGSEAASERDLPICSLRAHMKPTLLRLTTKLTRRLPSSYPKMLLAMGPAMTLALAVRPS